MASAVSHASMKNGASVASDIEKSVIRKISFRIIPLITLCYLLNQIDRVNVAFASLTMNADIGLTPEMYGFGAGLFFIGYIAFELPSNIILAKVGARIWIFRIMITWGLVAMAMATVWSPMSFYAMRFLLGLAEAGFLPGMVLYLTYWFPSKYRAYTLGLFITAAPLSSAFSGPLANIFLSMDGVWGLKGWQWLFLCEGLPTVFVSFFVLAYMTDRPKDATWLTGDERNWLDNRLAAEHAIVTRHGDGLDFWAAFKSPRVLLLCAIYFTQGMGIYGVVLWLPQMLRATGLSILQIGFLSIIPHLLAAIAMVWWCRRSDRVGERRLHVAIPAFVGAVGFMLSAYLGATPFAALATVTIALCGVWCMVAVFWTVPGQFLTGMAAAAGIAIINCVGSLGGFFGPNIVGWVRGATGSFSLALVILACGMLSASLLALLIPRHIGQADLSANEAAKAA